MNPPPSLVATVKALILETFVIQEAEAQDAALGLTMLAEEWGNPKNAENLNWSTLIKRKFSASHVWRSEDERRSFERQREDAISGYEFLISKNR